MPNKPVSRDEVLRRIDAYIERLRREFKVPPRRVQSDAEFLKAVGYGKDEAEWITEYDTFPIRACDRDLTSVGRKLARMNELCGRHLRYLKCSEIEYHGAIGGHDFYHNQVSNCKSYRCHVCWKYGWARDKAASINARFLTAEKLLGLPVSSVEHIFVSVPKRLYKLSHREIVDACILALKARGILDGCIIFHPFRKDRVRRDLVRSFHFHGLVYIEGGYNRCRACTKPVSSCWECDGFEGRTRRVGGDKRRRIIGDDWIVGLAKDERGRIDKRRSLFGTAWYQLEHSGYRLGVRNFHIINWFGRVAKRKFQTSLEFLPKTFMCPVCGGVGVSSELRACWLPAGVRVVANRGERGFMKNFTLPHVCDEEVIRYE